MARVANSSNEQNDVFAFINAVQQHKSIEEVEQARSVSLKGLNENYGFKDALRFAVMYGHTVYSDYVLR